MSHPVDSKDSLPSSPTVAAAPEENFTKQATSKSGLPYVLLSPSNACRDSPVSSTTANGCPQQPTTALKLINKLNQTICEYRHLVQSVGSSADGVAAREEMSELREKALQDIASCQKHLSQAFKSAESLSKKELQKLEQMCRILIASIHTLDRELRLTRHLFHTFPLFSDLEYNKEDDFGFVKTGLSEQSLLSRKASQKSWQSSPISLTALYWQERDSWQKLENEIMTVHDLDLALHRDPVLGPVVDYLTLCPTGVLPGAVTVSSSCDDLHPVLETTSLTTGLQVLESGESGPPSTTHHACIVISILIMLFIGGGVLIGVIFIIVG